MAKLDKPEEFSDAEAEAFIRYLTEVEPKKKKSIIDALLETVKGRVILLEFLKASKVERTALLVVLQKYLEK